MKRITQSLFEEIQKISSDQLDEKKALTHDEDKDGDEDAADYMMKRRKAGGQSHAQAHAATRKHNEEVDTEDIPVVEGDKKMWPGTPEYKAKYGSEKEKWEAKYGKSDAKKLPKYGYRGASGSETPEKGMKEETIIKHNNFTIEIVNNPTFKDFLAAASNYVEDQDDAITVAESFYKDEDNSIIIETNIKQIFKESFDDYRKQGYIIEDVEIELEDNDVSLMYSLIKEDEGIKYNYIHHGTVVEQQGEE